MSTVGAYEAKTHFSELLDRVQRGETVTVTRHGVAVARLIPIQKDADDIKAAVEDLRRFRRERRPTLDGVTIRELIEEGRR